MSDFDEKAEVEKVKKHLLERMQTDAPNHAADCYHYASAYAILVKSELAKDEGRKVIEPNKE